jgi:5-formyltetrahydrofolate cyclo-ligase
VQQVERLDPAPWDVALDLVVTERGVLHFARSPL